MTSKTWGYSILLLYLGCWPESKLGQQFDIIAYEESDILATEELKRKCREVWKYIFAE